MSSRAGVVMVIPNSVDILQAVLEATPDAIFVKDLEGRYLIVNAAAARFLGRTREEILGRRDPELYPEATARQFIEDDRRVLASGSALSFEGVASSDAGTQAYLVTKGVYRDPQGRILGIYGISHDVTEIQEARESQERTRDALFRAQKMEAVGQLTAGLAHDFSNILGVIIGSLDLLRLQLQRGGPREGSASDLIDAVLRAALQGKDLVSQLLAFTGRRELHPQPVDLNALVESMVRLITRTIGPRIDVKSATDVTTGPAFVDPSALEAALLNVALNARDAMPDGGTMTIRTYPVTVTALPESDDDPKPGAYAVLAVEDTGCGMPPEVLARAFEPMFTTKASTGGTGLGLSMVYGFAKQSGGTVVIESAPDQGTRVKLFLPSWHPGSIDEGQARA